MSVNAESDEGKVVSWWVRKDFGKQAVGALKTGLAAILCVWLGDKIGLIHSYWAAVSAIVVMGFDNTLTFASCRDRILGTAIGAFLGWITCYLWHDHYVVYGLAVAVCIFVCSAFAFDKAGRLAAVTLSIIVLVSIDGSPGRAAIARFSEVGFGIVVALAVTMLVFPSRSERAAIKATI
jgi:uncharacterized membrane protein YgaE (UPF0421/DUF939 family)